ncbi:MAG: carbohydrate ABC transporter permease [Geminicoccaceae bacterium]|nr:carbohydrate ABC transporter permease [Geminicoccaceae bacterium]MCB9945655.1 carbohydrate ABC transporter permease [Geminicoccaceae bacterium]
MSTTSFMPSTIEGQSRLWRWTGHLLLLVFIVWTLAPFYWMIVTSLKQHKEIYGTTATLWPREPTLESYRVLFFETEYMLFFKNSMLTAISTTAITVVVASLAAYSIARLDFPGRAMIARAMVYTYLVPQSLLFIPLFTIMVAVGLDNSLTGLSIAYLGFTVPFCTWLLMGFFMSIPQELEDAALVDGCSRLGVLVRIILPISLPALAVIAFFSFTLSWNEYLYAVVFNSDPAVRTIPTGLNDFIVEDVFFWGPIMGSTVLTVIPPLIVYFIFQRWLVTGLTMGAVKG